MVKKSTNETTAHEDIARLYRRAAIELPPSRLDATVVQAARTAIKPRAAARSPFSSTWTVPTSLAAVLVLSVALVLSISHERTIQPPETLSAPPAALSATAPGEMGARDETQPTAAHAPEPPAPPVAPQDTAPTSRSIEPVAPDRHKAAPLRRSAAPSRAEDNVFEALKPFSKTVPAQQAPVSAASPLDSYADIVSVQTKGGAGAYTFLVKLEGVGIDSGQDVDRWEVLSEDGRLLYRGALSPDDIKERSFASAGGPVPIGADTSVWVLAHTSSAGYAPVGFKGAPRTGFRKTEIPAELATVIAQRHGGQTGLGLRATPAR